MRNLLSKELRLSTPILTYIFIAFGFMTFIPGYPILCGAFFVCLGIFQGYQYARESNDIMYSILLPIKKSDVVKAKYLSAVFIELMTFVLCAVCTAVRMTAFADSTVYTQNVLMAANPVFLAFVLLIFLAFNAIFIGGFFKTAYKFGSSFVLFIVVNFIIIGIGEALHHFPGLGFLNNTSGSMMGVQYVILIIAAVIFVFGTVLSCKISQKRFEKIDL